MPRPTAPAPIAVSIADAAAMIGVSRRTVEQILHDGRLSSRRIGRRRVVRVADLHALLRAGVPRITPRSIAAAGEPR